MYDVVAAIGHGRSLDTLADLRRPDGESYLKSAAQMAAAAARGAGVRSRAPCRCPRLAGGDRHRRGAGGVVLGGPGLRAGPLPRLPGAARRDAVQPPGGALSGRRPQALPPAHAAGGPPAGPRAGRRRANRPGRVLPDLLGPDAVRQAGADPGPGPGERRRLDHRLRPGDHPGRSHPPQPALRAVHQRGPDHLPGRGHRLLLAAPRGGHPVHLPTLRSRAYRDGLQSCDLPGTIGRPRGRLCAGLPAAAGGPGGEGARDVRLGDGPARPRGGWWLLGVLPPPRRGGARSPGRRAGRAARPGRRDGPAGPRGRQGRGAGSGETGKAPGGVGDERGGGGRDRGLEAGGARRWHLGRRRRSWRYAGQRRLAGSRRRPAARRPTRQGRWTAGGSTRSRGCSSHLDGARTGWAGPGTGIRHRREPPRWVAGEPAAVHEAAVALETAAPATAAGTPRTAPIRRSPGWSPRPGLSLAAAAPSG